MATNADPIEDSYTVPNLDERISAIRRLSLEKAESLLRILDAHASVGGSTSSVPWDFISECSRGDKLTSLRACILCYSVTGGKQIPRILQLKSVLAIAHDRDCLVNTGTGTGKTLAIALDILLQDRAYEGRIVSLTISPLRRLQMTQENDFNTKYHCPTVVINDETPKVDTWYNENIYNVSTSTPGTALHIIVTAEQLFKNSEGHDPPFLRLLLKSSRFRKQIRCVNVDEVHVVHTSGISRYQDPAFRPAWGRLGDLRGLLPSVVPFRCLSATLTAYMVKTVETRILKPNYITIRSTANRANTTYATHQVPTTIEDPRNYECFIHQPVSVNKQPRVLIFFDNTNLADKVAEHLLSQFPDQSQYRSPPIVRHYHSLMSTRYLEQAHSDFTTEEGSCKILCATSGESVGIDFPDVEYVCNAGLPRDQSDAIQRAGRVGRRPGMMGLFVIFYDRWVREIQLDTYQGDPKDFDRPHQVPDKKSKSKTRLTARQRASYASVKYIQSNGCLREEFAEYLGEDSTDESSLFHTNKYCCDRHANKNNDPFELNAALPSPLFEVSLEAPTPATKPPQPKIRSKSDRESLKLKLESWVEINRGNFARHHILDKDDCSRLCKEEPGIITTPADVVKTLEKSDDWRNMWGTGIAKVVCEHDNPSRERRRVQLGQTRIFLSYYT